ncbi:aminotransferase class I/II-fold pyridoxal phosphate-dependent enzyme [Soehngenia saccharolytica]|nr:aminotransferase class I/II-fold pyridoxal phosphate-dependent enzyme [Soehngenia saccharolytica]
MEHGADIETFQGFSKGKLIDFSSNINPLGIPSHIVDEINDSVGKLNKYPDIKYRKLKKDVASYLDCDMENVIVGNGAVEIIDSFTMIANRVVVFIPSFSEYEKRARIHNKEIIRLNFDNNFKINVETIASIIQPNDLLILGNPNNPTGLRIDQNIVISIYDIVRKNSATLLLDEAFFEFCPVDYDSIELFKQNNFDNICIIRAATKFFALPGLRLGYGCSSIELVEKINSIMMPWSVNGMAESIAKYLFTDEKYIVDSKTYIKNEREFLLKELRKLSNIVVYDTDANFILIKLLNKDEDYALHFFLDRGVLIRTCSSFKSLGKDHIRIAIKSHYENIAVVNIFKELNKL